jgi:4-carboxymuconolactone decarboxylase
LATEWVREARATFVRLTDEALLGQVWPRAELSPKERSLVTVACLIAGANTEQLVYHLDLARQNGRIEAEMVEAITQPVFYTAGWPKGVLREGRRRAVFRSA